MQDKTILIASLLKPVDDTRMYEKFGQALIEGNKYKVIIIGFKAKNIPVDNSIQFIPLFDFNRFSLKRFFAPFQFYFRLLKLRPSVVIINTYELLFPSILGKWILKYKVIYDVRENYSLNIKYSLTLPSILKKVAEFYVKFTESIGSKWIDHFLLAEIGYEKELKFLREPYSIIQNKIPRRFIKPEKKVFNDRIQFLYCGTIAKEYGIFEAIDFVKRLRELGKEIYLEISGYCARQKVWKAIKRSIDNLNYIKVNGGTTLVPHEEILLSLERAHFALMPYHLLPQIKNCFPTKIYEAAAKMCPVLISNNPTWNSFIIRNTAGLVIDFTHYDPNEILEKMLHTTFYPQGISDGILWEEEQKALQKVISELLPTQS